MSFRFVAIWLTSTSFKFQTPSTISSCCLGGAGTRSFSTSSGFSIFSICSICSIGSCSTEFVNSDSLWEDEVGAQEQENKHISKNAQSRLVVCFFIRIVFATENNLCSIKIKIRKDLDKIKESWYTIYCVRIIFVIMKRQLEEQKWLASHTIEYLKPFHRKAKRIGR